MGTCEYFNSCALFEIDAINCNDRVRTRLQNEHCQNNWDQCARYMVWSKLGLDCVPALMLPNQKEWARQVLADNRALART